MLELPGRLERSTLGDVLGALHRSGATGALRIDETGPEGARQHVIYLREGLIADVESSAPAARQRCQDRLEPLFGVTRARLSFRVMGQRRSASVAPLEPPEFLHGRQRLRDTRAGEPAAAEPASAEPSSRERALALLGLTGQPSIDSIRSAFRQLARRWHPDRHPEAGELTRAALCRRFAQISDAYQELINSAEPAARAANAR
jgi:hypothetical protein